MVDNRLLTSSCASISRYVSSPVRKRRAPRTIHLYCSRGNVYSPRFATVTENGSKAIAKNQSPTTFAKRQREFNKKAKANDKLAKRAVRKALSDSSRITRNSAGT
jgi:hypothetical protein